MGNRYQEVSTRKLILSSSLEKLIADLRATGMIQIEPLADAHRVADSALRFHHRDPFDRLIVSQALTDGMVVLGRDEAFDDYGVSRVW